MELFQLPSSNHHGECDVFGQRAEKDQKEHTEFSLMCSFSEILPHSHILDHNMKFQGFLGAIVC